MSTDQLSIMAQAILAGNWGFSPNMTLTLQNIESRLTTASADAMQELIAAGIVNAGPSDDGCPEGVTYKLTDYGKSLKFSKSMDWMEKNGKFSLVEPVTA